MKDKSGWDGKLRVDRRAVVVNPEAVEDPDYSDEDAPPPEVVEADEGTDDGIFFFFFFYYDPT
jgi:protein phosphatase 1 regulatory subunit 7